VMAMLSSTSWTVERCMREEASTCGARMPRQQAQSSARSPRRPLPLRVWRASCPGPTF